MQKNDLNNNLPEVEDSINLNKTHDAANKVDLTGHTPKEIDGITYKSNKLSDAIDNVHDAKEKLKAYNANGLKGMRNNHRIKKGKEELNLKYKPDLADRNRESFLRAKGLKNKGKYAIREGAEALKHSKLVKFFQKAINSAKKIIKTIKTLGYPFFICVAVVVLLFNGIIFVYSISQAVGTSPHYYCDIEPNDNTKKDAKYIQYCKQKGSHMSLENLQGHYIVQDGSGPCTSCACLNMLLRFYMARDINFYDYLWDETGYCQQNVKANNVEGVLPRLVMLEENYGEQAEYANKHQPNSSYEFAAKLNIDPDWDYATMGYIRNEDEYEEYENNSSSSEWVWDMSQAPYGYSCCGWNKQWEIEGEIATCTHEEVSQSNLENRLIELLADHPSGVEVYNGQHAILITGYDPSEGFYIVDSALGLIGGFEGPMRDGNGIYTYDSCNALTGGDKPGVVDLYYIAEDTETSIN